jgi:hypothetical protein
MVTKNKTGEKRGKVKVGKLKLNKETVKDLTGGEQKQLKGGRILNQPSVKCSGDVYTRCATLCGSCGITCTCQAG